MVSLYYAREFVTLHQKNPGFDIGNNDGNPYLEIGGVKTTTRQYSLTFGFGDPGENPTTDTFDYAEFAIGFATFQKPSNYTATATYQGESLNGQTSTRTYSIWGVVNVPKDFVLPSSFINTKLDFGRLGDAALDDASSFLMTYAEEKGVPLASLANQLNTANGLYSALGTHLETYLDLIDQVTSGQIGLATFERLSDAASRELALDLTNTVGVHSTLVEAARQLVSAHTVTTDPAKERFDTSLRGDWPAEFALPDLVKFYRQIDSPSSDSLGDTTKDGDVVAGGLGNWCTMRAGVERHGARPSVRTCWTR